MDADEKRVAVEYVKLERLVRRLLLGPDMFISEANKKERDICEQLGRIRGSKITFGIKKGVRYGKYE